jgi:hypothetical protein
MTLEIPDHGPFAMLAKRLALTPAELLRRSVALYDLLTEVEEQGGKVKVEHDDGEIETLKVLRG